MKCNCYPQRVFKNEDITLSFDVPFEGEVSGLTLNVYTDGAVKKEVSEASVTIVDKVLNVTFNKGELDALADGVIRFSMSYSIGEDDYAMNTNTNMMLTTPLYYSAASIDDVWNEGYESGYTDGTADCEASAVTWQHGYDSGYTDGYETGDAAGFTRGYDSGYTEGKNTGYTSGITYQKSLLSNATFNVNGTYTRENGWSSVTVSVRSGEELNTNYLYKYQRGIYGYKIPCDLNSYGEYYMNPDDPDKDVLYHGPVTPFPYASDRVINVLYQARTISGRTKVDLSYYDESTSAYTSPSKAVDIPYGRQMTITSTTSCNITYGDNDLWQPLTTGLKKDSQYNLSDKEHSVMNLTGNGITVIEDGVYGVYMFPYTAATGSYIPAEAFRETEIAYIEVPANLTSIGDRAFYKSTLQQITFKSTTPPTFGTDVFTDCDDLVMIMVPRSAEQAYRAALSQYDRKINVYDTITDETVYGN